MSGMMAAMGQSVMENMMGQRKHDNAKETYNRGAGSPLKSRAMQIHKSLDGSKLQNFDKWEITLKLTEIIIVL